MVIAILCCFYSDVAEVGILVLIACLISVASATLRMGCLSLQTGWYYL